MTRKDEYLFTDLQNEVHVTREDLSERRQVCGLALAVQSKKKLLSFKIYRKYQVPWVSKV